MRTFVGNQRRSVRCEDVLSDEHRQVARGHRTALDDFWFIEGMGAEGRHLTLLPSLVLTPVFHGDDYISLFVSSLDITMSLGNLLQRIGSIDD